MHEKILGITSGAFDLFHTGHLRYLQRCRSQCDQLIVAVNSDEMTKREKGKNRPVIPQRQRMKIIEALRCVTMVCGIDKLEDLKQLSDNFRVTKIFSNAPFLNIHPVIGMDGTSAELVIVPDIDGLPETTSLIETIKRRFGCSNGD